MKSTLLVALLVATTALADAQRPRIAVHPLVLEGVDSKKDREELTALLPGIVLSVGKVDIASPSDVDAELKKKGQAFCTAESLYKCLSYIADHTSSAHAMRIELRRGGRAGEWELLANVVRVDGVVERQTDLFKFTQPEGVKLVPVARAKLEEFVGSLKLATLPIAPPVQAAVEPVPPPVAVVPKPEPAPGNVEIPGIGQPPLPPPDESIAPMRMTSFVVAGLAVLSLGASGGLALSVSGDASSLQPRLDANKAIPPGDLSIAKAIDAKSSAAVACLVVGAIAATTAVTLFVLGSGPQKTTLAPAPFPGGAGLVLSSGF